MNTNTLNQNQSLIDAIIKSDRPTVAELLLRGADVNAKDNNGHTVLIIATYKGEVSLVHLLLEKGADPRVTDRDGWTALKYAEELQETAIIELLGNVDELRTQVSAATKLETFTPPARTAIEVRSGAETVADKDWRDAVSLGTLIGGSIMILIILLTKPQVTQTAGNNSVSPGDSNSENHSDSTSSAQFTEADAVNLISNWLTAKKRIFAPPFDIQLAANLTTGSRYEKITEQNGSIDWLKENNAFYQYGFQEVKPTGVFYADENQANIDVIITEEITLYIDGVIDENNTNFNTNRYRYYMRNLNGKWKIYNYDKVE